MRPVSTFLIMQLSNSRLSVVSQQYGKDRIFFPIDKRAVVWYTMQRKNTKASFLAENVHFILYVGGRYHAII